MKYLGCTWGFEKAARVSEYTRAELSSSDHCVLLDDLTLIIEIPGVTKTVSRGSLAKENWADTDAGLKLIVECKVIGTSSKGKVTVKPMLIARRSIEECQFLKDVAQCVSKSRGTG